MLSKACAAITPSRSHRGIADEKRNAFGQVGGNASGQVYWHFAGSAIDARSLAYYRNNP
jgi:hypothetical protein